ncbi:hypothetical protein CR513_45379, partial [Mucuna pruriens]
MPLPHNTRDPPYGMSYGWNIDNPEEREQQNTTNDGGTGPTTNTNSRVGPSTGAGPHVQQDQKDQHQALRNTIPHKSHRQVPPSEEKWQSLDERLHVVKGGNRYGLEAVDLCLIPNVGLPADFKTPEFDKYKGSSCPRVHLAMYCCKMTAYIYDNKVLIHCFQDSLTEAALSWNVNLE